MKNPRELHSLHWFAVGTPIPVWRPAVRKHPVLHRRSTGNSAVNAELLHLLPSMIDGRPKQLRLTAGLR